MKRAEDFRRIARNALSGRWGIAVIAGLLASLLGAVSSRGPELEFDFSENSGNVIWQFAGRDIYSSELGWNEQIMGWVIGGVTAFIVVALIMAAVYVILGSVIEVGYARFHLDLVDGQKEPEIGTMFGYFKHWKTTAVANLLRGLYILLWSLLLIIPGIITSYSYAMTGYILAEHPEMAPKDALAQSKDMMAGNRFRLFCLEFSFIGWDLLCALTLGIGNLWLEPYKRAAITAFYREVSETETVITPGEGNPVTDAQL